MQSLWKKGIAEFIGTFVLVFAACGVAAYTAGDLVPTALAFGLVIVAMAYSIGRISGCHINPAVSLGCLLTKRMTFKEFLVYIAAQIIGGFAGGAAIFGIAKLGGQVLPGDACNMVPSLDVSGYIAAILVEIVLTCIFVYVILNVTDSKDNGAGKKAGIIIGLTLTLVHLIGINITGTSVNPARSIATAFTSLIYNGSTEALAQVWVFIVAPLIGGLIAAVLFKLLHKESKKAEEKQE